MDKAALIHAAFKGLAEGLMAVAETAAPAKEQRRQNRRRRSPVASRRNAGTAQMPLSPELGGNLRQQFEAVDPRGPDTQPPPSVADLDAMFRGNESVKQLTRQMRMQEAAARATPPQKPEEVPLTGWGIPDR